jgi:hypothetical protein
MVLGSRGLSGAFLVATVIDGGCKIAAHLFVKDHDTATEACPFEPTALKLQPQKRDRNAQLASQIGKRPCHTRSDRNVIEIAL